ncbi:MAG: DUF6498-containing protein [Pseudomonadota bacterium]|nr:DUF6498-containing protein [Pseudomonadota bacterium]
MSPSARNLLLVNAATLVVALALGWDAGALLWPYWIQSVVVGWYARRRILCLRQFSTEGFTSNGARVPEDEGGKRSTANFFLMHYGMFHVVYLLFLSRAHPTDGILDLLVLLALGLSFALSQRETFAVQHAADLRGRPNLATLMFLPYLRVIPMHLAILLGAASSGAWMLVLFTVLKTAADLRMDALDRRKAMAAANDVQAAP